MFARVTSRIKNLISSDAEDLSKVSHLAPERPFVAIGDIHGCKVLLDKLLTEIGKSTPDDQDLIFLGDYIDRGPQSREVLAQIYELTQSEPEKVTCLMGNHERMMLDFIDDPAGEGLNWLRHGGLDTLASFGISSQGHALDSEACVELADQLEKALPDGLQAWLRGLPLQWSTGNVHCVHAAMSPRRAPNDQRSDVLLWGHPDFLTRPREDENFIVHGHTIVKRAGIYGSRISTDTGAYRTGRLSAVHVLPGGCPVLGVQ